MPYCTFLWGYSAELFTAACELHPAATTSFSLSLRFILLCHGISPLSTQVIPSSVTHTANSSFYFTYLSQ